jgi:Domain of unknown function (DUF3854)
MTRYGLHIFPQHAALLKDSAISPEVARARGYVSVDTATRLESAGFARSQRRNTPGLLIPIYGTDGELRLHQYRPDNPRLDKGKPRKYETPWRHLICLDVPPTVRGEIDNLAVPLWITEGSRKADAAASAWLCCIALIGVDGWQSKGVALPDWKDGVRLKDREVMVAFDSDVMTKESVARSLRDLTTWLEYRGARVRHVILPDGEHGAKTGLDDYLAAGHGVDELYSLARDPAEHPEPGMRATPPDPSANSGKVPAARSLTDVEAAYSRWLHDKDLVPTRAVLAAYVANMCLPGDPVWVMLVGGSGAGKTERILPVTCMPRVVMASTVTGEAALLSATPKKDRADNATGGLLRQVGEHGMLVLKDFTSILSMSRDARSIVLAAMREIFDGRWDRPYGTDGGQTLTWQGRCGLLAGCTSAIDSAHSVLDKMGTRFVFVRLPESALDQIGAAALDHMGKEKSMRAELAEATAGLLSHLPGRPHEVDPAMKTALVSLACLASQARSPVQRDYKGDIDLVLDAEAPTRIIKQLGQLWRACGMLGLGRADSWEVVRRAGLDSVPKLRGAVLRYLAADDGTPSTTQIGEAVDHPSRSVRRALEDLAAHGVVIRIVKGKGWADTWTLSERALAWNRAIEGVPEMADGSTGTCTECGEPLDPVLVKAGYTTHGEEEAAL